MGEGAGHGWSHGVFDLLETKLRLVVLGSVLLAGRTILRAIAGAVGDQASKVLNPNNRHVMRRIRG